MNTDMPATKKKKAVPLTFEGALSELEGITRQLERDDLTLERALASFEEGVGLMRFCEKHLRSARGKLMELATGDGGEFITTVLGENLESFIGGENGGNE
jgi:exodeoxyribonuclease VII small subunit